MNRLFHKNSFVYCKKPIAIVLALFMLLASLHFPDVAYAGSAWTGEIDTMVCVGGWQMAELEKAVKHDEQFSEDWKQHYWVASSGYDADSLDGVSSGIIKAVDDYASKNYKDEAEGLAVVIWFGSSTNFKRPSWWSSGDFNKPHDDPNNYDSSDVPSSFGDEIFDTEDYYHREPQYSQDVVADTGEVNAAYDSYCTDQGYVLDAESGQYVKYDDKGNITEYAPSLADSLSSLSSYLPNYESPELDRWYEHDPETGERGDVADDMREERDVALNGLPPGPNGAGASDGNERFELENPEDESGGYVYVRDTFTGWESVRDHASAPTRYKEGLSEATSYATSKKAKVYWMSVSTPRDYAMLEDERIKNVVAQFHSTSHAYLGWNNNDHTDEFDTTKTVTGQMKNHTNANTVQEWNKVMQSNMPSGAKWIDVYTPMAVHNPYFTGGDQASFNQESSQTIWYMMWNSVQMDNPKKELEEAVDDSLYSVSCSLTAYVNNAVGLNANEDNTKHEIPTVHNLGDGGNYLGYGDSDYDFYEGLIATDSKLSSIYSYKSLLDKEGDKNNYMYLYARYGYLLNDLGLDSVSRGSPQVSNTLIPGGLVTLFYAGSSFGGKIFNFFIMGLQYANPFQFLSDSKHVLPGVKNIFNGDYDSWTTGESRNINGITGRAEGESTSGEVVQHKQYANSNIKPVQRLRELISEIYDIFYEFGWEISITLFFAFVLFLYFMRSRAGSRRDPQTGLSVRSLIIRILFIGLGIPMLGILYTHSLDFLDDMTSDGKLASTQLIVTTFVDFGDWAKFDRLSPVEGMTLVSDPTDNMAGEGSVDSFRKLRSTAFTLNKSTRMIPEDVTLTVGGSDMSKETDVAKFNTSLFENADVGQTDLPLWRKCIALVMLYTNDNKYYASDWESDMKSAASNDKDNITMGRRAGIVEENFDKDKYQGEKTFYHMVDNTNEYKDWDERSMKDNSKITKGDSYEKFNIFSNGKLNSSANGSSVESKTVVYTSPNDVKPLYSDKLVNTRATPSKKGGLSTLSMYNYLSSKFMPTGVRVYSNVKAVNEVQKESHKYVNVIGGSGLSLLFYLHCLVVLILGSFLALYYGLKMLIYNFQQGFKALTSIPFAMIGVLRSIASVIVSVFGMIVNVLLTIFLYTLMSELIVFFVNILEVVVKDMGVETTVMGGVLANIYDIGLIQEIVVNSKTGIIMTSLFILILLLFVSFYVIHYRKPAVAFLCSVENKILLCSLPEEVKEEMAKTKQKQKREWVIDYGYAFQMLAQELSPVST